MAYTLTGSIKKIFPKQTFPSGFSKREVVVTSAERFPQDVKFDCLKEKESILDGFKEGDEVTVHFDIRGREYQGRFFVDLNAWKIDRGAPAQGSDGPPDYEPEESFGENDPGDDVPF